MKLNVFFIPMKLPRSILESCAIQRTLRNANCSNMHSISAGKMNTLPLYMAQHTIRLESKLSTYKFVWIQLDVIPFHIYRAKFYAQTDSNIR